MVRITVMSNLIFQKRFHDSAHRHILDMDRVKGRGWVGAEEGKVKKSGPYCATPHIAKCKKVRDNQTAHSYVSRDM